MLVLDWKEKAFIGKMNSRWLCWFPAAIVTINGVKEVTSLVSFVEKELASFPLPTADSWFYNFPFLVRSRGKWYKNCLFYAHMITGIYFCLIFSFNGKTNGFTTNDWQEKTHFVIFNKFCLVFARGKFCPRRL